MEQRQNYIFFFFQSTIWIYLLLLLFWFFILLQKTQRENKNMELVISESLYSVADVCGLLSSYSQWPSSLPISYTQGWKKTHWISQPSLHPDFARWTIPGQWNLRGSLLEYCWKNFLLVKEVRPIKKILFTFVFLLCLFCLWGLILKAVAAILNLTNSRRRARWGDGKTLSTWCHLEYH